jgi:hypothetical protein
VPELFLLYRLLYGAGGSRFLKSVSETPAGFLQEAGFSFFANSNQGAR